MGMRHPVWLLAMLATRLFAQDTSPGRGVNFYSLAKEQALGAQMSQEYRQRTRVIEDARVQAYLNDLGRRLAARLQGAAYNYTFELVSDDGLLLNEPAAFPGGAVFVPASLIRAAASEDELAGMLAHAIAHIAARHGTKQATKAEIVNQATVPLIYMGGSSGFAMRQGAALAIPRGFLKFQRQLELEADALAVLAMAAAGYDPRAMESYLGRMLQPEGRDERMAALGKAIESIPAGQYPAHEGFRAIQEAVARLDVKPAPVAPPVAPRLAR